MTSLPPLPSYTVQQFIDQLNELFSATGPIAVEGEVSSLQRHPSGIYLTLKDPDSGSLINCYIHPRFARLINELTDGMHIKSIGVPNIYGAKGKFSFIIQSFEIIGAGGLQKAYEQLKQRLQGEGLFEQKRALPLHIQSIGIITSRTGAVIDDFRKNLRPLKIKLRFFDVRVEGESAIPMITEAIEWFNTHEPNTDLLVIMRGGGSLEDLQAFNSETVTRAVFGSRVPTICAIGHDRDIPLASLAADIAVSTPTAAATTINRTRDLLEEKITNYQHALVSAIHHLATSYQSLIREFTTIAHRIEQQLSEYHNRVTSYEKYLTVVNPLNALAQGYSIVTDENDTIVTDATKLTENQSIAIRFAQGSIKAIVEEKS